MSTIIAVVGDSILDHYVHGDVHRISPEAPVPVVTTKYEMFCPGGAAHVASSIQALNNPVILFSPVGADAEAKRLTFSLDTMNVSTDVTTLSEYHTSVKTRIMVGGSQVLRTDREMRADASPTYAKFHENVLFKLNSVARDVKAIIVSDYAKGAISPELRQALQDIRASYSNIFLFVDAKPTGLLNWHSADCITPNFSEACAVLGVDARTVSSKSDSACEALATQLSQRLPNLSLAVVTRAQNGCSWYDNHTKTAGSLPAFTTCKTDVIGAGDTFIAALSVAVCEGRSIRDSIVFANAASALAVSKPGTTVVHRMELDLFMARPTQVSSLSKLMSQQAALSWAQQLRSTNERIVFANGCFDLLHAGHVHMLEQAKFAGGYLLVGVNTDASIKALKGDGRPFVGAAHRARMVAALECVDAVVTFEQEELVPLIEAVKPDILVKGSEYASAVVPGAEFVVNSGGQLLLVDMVPDVSTTKTAEGVKTQA